MKRFERVIAAGHALASIRELFAEYEKELDADISFQQFSKELADPLGKYGSPKGALLLALWNDMPAGCIAVAPMSEVECCEMKRLYVRPAYRQYGIGRDLVQELFKVSRELGYRTMRLDTLKKLHAAIHLYTTLGFYTIQPYYHNPLPDVVFMEKTL